MLGPGEFMNIQKVGVVTLQPLANEFSRVTISRPVASTCSRIGSNFNMKIVSGRNKEPG